MRVVNTVCAVFVAQLLAWAGHVQAVDDFDLDALFDMDVPAETSTVAATEAEEAQAASEPTAAAEVEADVDADDEAWLDELFADEEEVAPTNVMPAVEEATPDVAEVDELVEEDAMDWALDEPAVEEAVPAESPDVAEVDDIVEEDAMDWALDEPAVEEAASAESPDVAEVDEIVEEDAMDWAFDEPAVEEAASAESPDVAEVDELVEEDAMDWALDEPAVEEAAPAAVAEEVPAEEATEVESAEMWDPDLMLFPDEVADEVADEVPAAEWAEDEADVDEGFASVEEELVEDEVDAQSSDVEVRDLEPNQVARELAAQEEVRRQANELQGLRRLDEGYRALESEEYEVARNAFTEARNLIPDRPARQEQLEQARWGLAEAHYRIALEVYRDDGDMRVARNNLDSASELSPEHRGLSALQRRVAREEARRIAEEARPIPVERRPEIMERRATTEETMQEARAFYEAGELDRAEALFESILVSDQYNTDAMRYLRRIAEDQRRAADVMRRSTSTQMIRDVREAWTPPRRADAALPEDLLRAGPTDQMTRSRRLQEKMESIIIPRIEFRQANIRDVVEFLVVASEAQDPDQEGVNIILNLNMPESVAMSEPEAAAPADFDDPWGDEWNDSTPIAEPSGSTGVPNVTLNLRRISLMEAIRYITEVAGLRYRIEDSVVIITPAGVAEGGRVVTRLYPVQPSFLDVVSEREEVEPQGGFGNLQEFGSRRAPSAGGRSSDVKDFFVGAGVPFPVGTSITYNPAISQLIVANTPENLERFERILSQLNVVPSQVEIEARFVEVAEDDMKELGLQWLFTDNYEFLQRQSGGPFGGRERIQVDAGNASAGTRFFGELSGGIEPVAAGAANATFLGNILSVSSILTNPELSVVLHALSQNGNTDVLSAPRVTTRSGINASIEVVTEIIYPTEFRVTEPVTQSEGGLVTPPVVTPDSFETRRTGVILNVTPTVGPDGYTIDLALAPEVAELVDWLQYGSRISIPGGDPETGEITLREFTFNIPQPVFASRNVQTSIVIWDGQTVVMGGLMRERLVTINDKIPILGDIPLLGRLFRNEGSRSRKENLLIFVTARLVDPAGKPIHRADAMGMTTVE
jgi:general secretion pathway protein D